MQARLTAAALAILALTGGARAQTAQAEPQLRQPRPTVPAPNAAAPPIDLEATRKKFDAEATKRATGDRRRDAQLNHAMRTICQGCDGTAPARRAPSARSRSKFDRADGPVDTAE